MALGAQRRDVFKLIIAHGMILVLIGTILGTALSLAITRLFATLLFGIRPTNALTLAIAGLGLMAVALLACLIPARRATKVDPIVTLRYE